MKPLHREIIRFSIYYICALVLLPFFIFPLGLFAGFYLSKKYFNLFQHTHLLRFSIPHSLFTLYSGTLFVIIISISAINDPVQFEEVLYSSYELIKDAQLYTTEDLALIKEMLSIPTPQIVALYSFVFFITTFFVSSFGMFVSYLKCKLI